MNPFFSLNSWVAPGMIYQGQNPVEIVTGGRSDWDRLELALRRHRRDDTDALHPTGAAVGYFTYEGDFWFGFYPELHVQPAEVTSELWKARRRAAEEPMSVGALQPNQTKEAFAARVRNAQSHIAQGEIYQVNLAQRFAAPFQGNAYALFEQLMWRSPAPGGAFLDLGERQVLSASPELFLRIQGREIITRPIKGTRPRDRDPLRDGQLAYELMTDPKELAELIMITDLERNDLGQICEYGSVTVSDLLKLERYAQVYHLMSTVEGRLREGVSAVQAIAACFPGGSISGAPKKRACEMIRELEPCARGIYTGAIGYIAFNGDAAFNIAIRTMVREANELSFYVGSGITADSVPEIEYEETLHKASGMRQALDQYVREAANIRVSV